MFSEIILIIFISLIGFFFVIFKFGHVKCESNICLNGKVAVVTGGSSGIGYQVVLQLASRGCKVIIADKQVDQQIKTSIIDETNNSNILLEFVDFASFKSVRSFAEKLGRSEEKVDILINNVGIGKAPEQPSQDGLNMTMQINHYSPFLLTHLLVDLLNKSGAGRVLFTASALSFLHVLTPGDITNDEVKLPKYKVHDYFAAKLCTIVTSDIFARKLREYNITCNSYHPGVVNSTFYQNTRDNVDYTNFMDRWILIYLHKLLRLYIGVNPREASETALNLAISKEYSEVTGMFFGKYFPNLRPRLANDRKVCEKIWNASEKIVKLKPEEKL